MAETNFLIFNEENNPDRTYNDSEYKNATQRLTGVIPGMALSRQHNKMYFQWSAMCKAIADFLVTSGYNCMDNNVEGITEGLTKTVTDMIEKDLSTHNTDNEAHKTLFDKKLDKTGGTLTGDLNASGYNITATKFIGNLQGKADNAANADLATKANQDSQGQTINTTYVKGVTGSNATLTVTKGNGTTSTVTINNVAHSTSADSAIEAGNINKGFQVNEEDFHISDFRQTILGRANNGICARPFCGKLPNNTSVSSPGIAFGGIDTHGFIQMEYGTSNIYVGAGNANKINWYKRLAITDSPAFSGTPTAPTPGVDTNNTQLATCGFVRNAIAKYAPMLDTLKKVYPVGSIYMSTVSTNPATLFGFGTWEAMPAGRVLLAQGKSSWGTTYNAGSTGGEATHKLTVGELPAHNHTAPTNTTGNHTHQFQLYGPNGNTNMNFPSDFDTNHARNKGTTLSAGNHSHTININNTGSSQSHNNMQPYLTVYMWKRTA